MSKRWLVAFLIIVVAVAAVFSFRGSFSTPAPDATQSQTSHSRQIVDPDGDCKLRTATNTGEAIEIPAKCHRTDGAIVVAVEGCKQITFVRQNAVLNGVYVCPDCEAANSTNHGACPLSGTDRGAGWAVTSK